MEKCVKCGADTILYVNGVPLCMKCDAALSLKKREAGRESQSKPKDVGSIPKRRSARVGS